MSRRYYAGIGARKDVPADTLRIMSLLANKLESEGWILRSGGAEGSDSAFLSGLRNPRANAEIYLPSRKFNNQIAGSQPHFINYQTLRAAADARRMVPIYHAYAASLKPFTYDLMARNAMQVLGSDLQTPSRMVVAYTPDAATGWDPRYDPMDRQNRRQNPDSGGTGQALRIAEVRPDIEIRNLADPAVLESVKRYLGLI
jgi:hypothetical protein